MSQSRVIFVALVCLAAGLGGGWYYANRPAVGPTDTPMPPPTPAPTPTDPKDPKKPGPAPSTVQVKRIEVVTESGQVAVVLTTQGGVPVAVINDHGKARTIDLAWLARKVE